MGDASIAMEPISERKQLYQDLCDLEIPSVIKLSPNARQVLYATNLTWSQKKGKHCLSTIWLGETGQANSSRKLTSGLSKDYWPRWNPNGDSLAFISDRAEAGKKWAIYMMNVRNGTVEGEAYPITDTDNERPIAAFEFSPDGKRIALIRADPKTAEEKAREDNGEDWQVWCEDWTYDRLYVIDDLTTRKVSRVTGESGQQRHVTGFCWSPDSENIVFANTKSPHIEEPYLTGSDISILWLGQSTRETVGHIPNVVKNVKWAADGKIYFCSGTPDDKECAGHCHVRAAFGVENDVDSITLVEGRVVAKVQHGLRDQICLVPSGEVMYSEHAEIQAFDVTLGPNNKTIIAVATSDVNAPIEVYTRDIDAQNMVKLSTHGATFSDRTFGTCQFLNTRSADDKVELDAVHLTPSLATPSSSTPLPTVVLIHGGPTSRNTNAFNTLYYFWTPYLLSLGYAILLPNYRGSSGKGEAFASWSIKPSGRGKYDHEDVITLTQLVIDQELADPGKLMVGGLSQGGFLTYLCSVRNDREWRFKAAIALAGITDVDTMALTSDLGATLETELSGGRTPWNVPKVDTRSRQASALWEFHEAMQRSKETGKMIVPPMLIMHGEKDERCPITQAWGMRRALAGQNLPFEFVTYPRQGHLFAEQKLWNDMAERVGRWCDTYIRPGR
ncbi:Acylamino-acid-releasing enzyme [Fulvia fulva]|nr:Acylamino-acid-releasing enzyme [Fulvia fulva]WPV16381.1 Acylamino-acid-releasing enzyme [Fulvia fulva]WPV31041.1 Acylamino-acid-releasing enzyme [Fulvia fulva]